MLTDIRSMQKDERANIKDFLKRKGQASKRTTIILEKEERDYIDSLIREGKEKGIKPLVSKLLDIYRSMMIYDWRFPGEYYCGISRIAFVNVELLSILIQQIPKEKWHCIGKQIGCSLKVSMETTSDLPAITPEGWDKVFRRFRVQGFGDISVKDKYLLVKTPFINEPEIVGGILEGLLDVKLDLKNTVPPLVFEVQKKS